MYSYRRDGGHPQGAPLMAIDYDFWVRLPERQYVRLVALSMLMLLMLKPGDLPAQLLYDGALGTLPSAQGWNYVALPGTAMQSVTNNAVRLDTSVEMSEKAGYFNVAPEALESAGGFCLLFTVQVHAEFHTSNHRAGFSVIVLGNDRRGIELGFWTNQVFAQSDSPLFTQAEKNDVNTVDSAVDYALIFYRSDYVLRAGNDTILTGPLRDYTAFVGAFDPYETPNFLFLGDDTSSASATVSLARIALITPPRLSMESSGVLSWTGVKGLTYSVERSSDLLNWPLAASVSSSTATFRFTNSLPGTNSYFRVVWP